ncbi:lipid-A-disaccharide synthase [compost metagenome]
MKIKYISLVNLIAEKTVVKELIQDDCNEKALNAELDLILNDVTYRSKMLQNYAELHSLMGEPGASERTAKLIIDYLEMDQ